MFASSGNWSYDGNRNISVGMVLTVIARFSKEVPSLNHMERRASDNRNLGFLRETSNPLSVNTEPSASRYLNLSCRIAPMDPQQTTEPPGAASGFPIGKESV